MTDSHKIAPSPELVEQWRSEPQYITTEQAGRRLTMVSMTQGRFLELMEKSANYGADQELEACCEWLVANDWKAVHKHLRAARRPKPPSLKETLLARVARIPGEGADTAYLHHWLENESQRLVDALHEAIKSLPE